ncbi:ATP-binding protein [[Clostridium] fimetarium]|uniref:4Fe-4S binding domain-containing protein n=1 Tax=[Clostridium] fimetarium TaxID=99656 RepID=A0A1I0Q9Z5_9FIRM|nr:4Fe-4S binding protein [[Clostridium] fimetarium]SEW23700.1 4Fe-4S binding domain-containing protein [[Clostridium] fimetarium]
MIRKIIKINEDLCNGCGLCANACHEAAIAIVDGKAKLIRDDYCDGLGNCLPVCPTNAIFFEEREALTYNEEEVKKNQESKGIVMEENTNKENTNKEITNYVNPNKEKESCSGGGCPGSMARELQREQSGVNENQQESVAETKQTIASELRQWPVQIKLVPVKAPYFENANLLVAADCTAYAYANFHNEFMKNHVTVIGCPKLDDGDYSEKLTEIIKNNNIKSVKVLRMEVPCCGGIEFAVMQALKNSGKMIPWQVVTISCDGQILES